MSCLGRSLLQNFYNFYKRWNLWPVLNLAVLEALSATCLCGICYNGLLRAHRWRMLVLALLMSCCWLLIRNTASPTIHFSLALFCLPQALCPFASFSLSNISVYETEVKTVTSKCHVCDHKKPKYTNLLLCTFLLQMLQLCTSLLITVFSSF